MWCLFEPICNTCNTLRANCQDTIIFPYSVRMREKTDQKKLHIWTLFTQITPTYPPLSSAKSARKVRIIHIFSEIC